MPKQEASLQSMSSPIYTAIFFKVYRLMQLGEHPPQRYLALVQKQGLSSHLQMPASETAEHTPKQIALDSTLRLMAVQRWLTQTEGCKRVRATFDNKRVFTPQGVLWLASHCEWARLNNMFDLPFVHQGVMHSACLELGWGDPITAYQTPKKPTDRVYFFCAYPVQEGQLQALKLSR